ncbi:MotA/TolQ/ExbB proton channel family protein [Cyanobium sp. ATX 6A2]|nr:MotA/TolQ/ExbB proton channel family protein [Cyanobium sp. ATX 6A2]
MLVQTLQDPVNAPFLGIYGPVAVPLILLSIAVLTVGFDRWRYWVLWWRRRESRRLLCTHLAEGGTAALERQFDDWDREMRYGEPLLHAASVIGPLLGLVGTVIGLMRVLASLGPQLLVPAGASLRSYGMVLTSTALGLTVAVIATTCLFANQALRQWQLDRLHRWRQRRLEAGLP